MGLLVASGGAVDVGCPGAAPAASRRNRSRDSTRLPSTAICLPWKNTGEARSAAAVVAVRLRGCANTAVAQTETAAATATSDHRTIARLTRSVYAVPLAPTRLPAQRRAAPRQRAHQCHRAETG